MFIDHQRSGVVYNFGRFCLSVYLYVCQTINFESLDVGSSYLYMYVPPSYTSQVHIGRLSGQGQGHRSRKRPKCLFSQCKLRSPITPVLQCFDTVGLVIWPVKIVPEMTYNVSSGTLSLYTTTFTVCLKKTSPTFLAVTWESIVGFS